MDGYPRSHLSGVMIRVLAIEYANITTMDDAYNGTENIQIKSVSIRVIDTETNGKPPRFN